MIVYPWLSVSERHFDKASYTRGSGRVGCYKEKMIAFEFCVVTSLFSVHLSAGTDFDKSQAERVISCTHGTPQNVFTGGNEWQLPKGLFVFFSSICWWKCQAPWLASILSIGMCRDDSSAGQFRGSGAAYAETTEWVHGKKIYECSGKPQTQSREFYTHTFFFFVVVWLCFLNPLPGRSARPSMPTGFLSCDIYFFPLLSLFCFSVRLSSCAGADGPRAAHLVVITLSIST